MIRTKLFKTVVLLAALSPLGAARANEFHYYQSGSTGADGAFEPVLDNGVLKNAPPNATYTYVGEVMCVDLPLNASGTFNFTKVTIPENVRVRFIPNAANTPVTILASGDVTIAGEIDVSAASTQAAANGSMRMPGPGGFAGGRPQEPGNGPGGGTLPNRNARPSPLQLPLAGGSGGSGGVVGDEGGGGGGAIYIASSGRIVFPPLSASAAAKAPYGLALWSGSTGGAAGQAGIFANEVIGPIRCNPAQNLIISTIKSSQAGGGMTMYPRSLLGLALPAPPAARISAVGATAIPNDVDSSDLFQVAQAGANKIKIETRNLPPGIVFDVYLQALSPTGYAEGEPKIVSTFPTSGTFQLASAEATGTFGNGVTFIYAHAKAPVNLALAPRHNDDPICEVLVATNSNGESSFQFVTAKGARLSYEAAMRLAVTQNRWQFVRQFSADRRDG